MAKRKDIQSLTKEDLKKIKESADTDDMKWLHKDIQFMMHIPPDLHRAAKRAAFDSELSLHDYIIKCIKICTDVVSKK